MENNGIISVGDNNVNIVNVNKIKDNVKKDKKVFNFFKRFFSLLKEIGLAIIGGLFSKEK